MTELKPGADWEPMPAECRERFQIDGSSLAFHTRFTDAVQTMRERNEIEVEFRSVTSKPDSRNKYWWRIKPAGHAFDRLFVGDLLTASYPLSNKCRFKVREIQMVHSFGPEGYSKDKHPSYALQLYTVIAGGRGEYGWMDSSHDRHMSIETVKDDGYRLIEKAQGQIELF